MWPATLRRPAQRCAAPRGMRAARGAAGESDLVSHDGRQLRFGYRPLQRWERCATLMASFALLGLLARARQSPWQRAARVLSSGRSHWLVWSLSALWIVGSAWATHAVLKLCAVMCFARPKLLPPESILPSASSSIRHLPGKVAVHLLRRPPDSTEDVMPVLCFHGFGANATSYEDLLDALMAQLPSALLLCPDQVGFGLTRRPSLEIHRQLRRNDLPAHLLRPKDQASALDSLTPLQMYTLSGNAVIANALLNSEPLLPSGPSSLLVIGHSMGAITAAAVAVSQARQGTVVNLILESPAFLTNPTKHLKSSTIGAVTALSLRFQRAFLRLVLQLPGLTYNRRFWERGLSVASQLDGEALKRQVLRYRWPSLSVRWAYGLSNFVTARLITMEDALVLHELIEASMEGNLRVLIVTGDQDKVVPVGRSKFLQKLLQCDLELIEGCGHIAHEEDPERFAELVARFLKAQAMETDGLSGKKELSTSGTM
ncbi:unnamed protein product [Durusdinium trenchii]|uniref:AB hydrolase-1 domain-containing protein n=3 Tax=Durusdinium trenchii TaxID=1381693 RepID=A0ABP0KHE5_9DINO